MEFRFGNRGKHRDGCKILHLELVSLHKGILAEASDRAAQTLFVKVGDWVSPLKKLTLAGEGDEIPDCLFRVTRV